MKRLVSAAAAAIAFASLLAVASAKDDDADPAAREWSQARGNAGRTAGSAVAPLAGDPVEAWRQALPGPILGEPVSWGGVVFVAAQKDKGRRLLAFRAATGEALGGQDLGAGGRTGLAVWQGVVVALDADQIRSFRHSGSKFSPGWSVRGRFSGPPCVWRGFLFACDGPDLLCIDVLRNGAKAPKAPVVSATAIAGFDETKSLKGEAVGGAVGVYRNRADGVLYAVNVATLDNVAMLTRTRVDDLGAKTQLRYPQTEVIGTFSGAVPDEDRWDMVPCRIEGESAKATGAWIVLSPRPFSSGGTGRFVPDAAKASGLNLVTAPAVLDAIAYSFSGSGDLQTWRANGKTETLVQATNAPPGTKPGPATRAGGVVFLGNFAVDVEARRVIWSLKREPVTAAIPVGDKRLVFATKDELVCVADSSVLAEAPAPEASAQGGGAAKAPAAAAPAMRVPVEMKDYVLLDDGRQVEGTFERTGRAKVTLHPKEGESFEVSRAAVVVAETAGQVDIRGDDAAAFKVWRGAVRGAYCDTMESIFQEYAKASMLDDARRVMQRMRENGAAEARLQKLDAALNGKSPRADAARAKKFGPQEEAARTALLDGVLAGSEWCAKRGLATAATALVNEAGRMKGGADAALEERAKAQIPDGFPWKSAPDATKQWMRWADALLPSSSEFVAKEDPVWGKLDGKPWNDGATLGFRTRNVLMFLRDQDPALCGKALQLAEGTVRALQVFLNEGEPDDVAGDSDRLEIRIHKNKADYHAETTGTGGQAPEWSAGNFSPAEKISRFYVERNREGVADVDELTRVLTHEFTHHYMNVRWMHGASGGGAGFWVVEGMAEFVQYQAFRMDQRGLKFDDETVPGLDGAAQAEKAGVLFKAEKFVDMSQADFATLQDGHLLTVKLRNSFTTKNYTQRGLWYEQAGALSFFFLQAKGPDVRRTFVNYVRLHYQGRAPTPGWSFLGYESAEALDKDFTDYLKRLRGG